MTNLREEWICSECGAISYWAPVRNRKATADRAWPVTLACPRQHENKPHYRTNTADGQAMIAEIYGPL